MPVGPGLGWQDLRTIGACLTLRADGGPRIMALCFGYDDFTGDLGVRRTHDGLETLYPRAQLAIAARAMDVLAIDGPLADFSELAALAEESSVSRQLGFTGKQCIHPSQIDTINIAFTPAPGPS